MGARYYVDFSTDLLREIAEEGGSGWPSSFRLVERFGPRGVSMERWLVEDDEAPEDLEAHLIDVWFGRKSDSPVATVVDRIIQNVPGLN